MKRIFFIFLLVASSINYLNAATFSTGIVFFKGDWKGLLNEAKKQHKLIFLDFYTDWCAPCKRMDAEIFPDKNVGAVYNQLFVSYKVNAEKGNGIELAKKFSIKAYPTWIFLDETGSVIFRADDYMSAVKFIDLGKRVATQKNAVNSLAHFEKEFEKGNRESGFLKSYIIKRSSMKLKNSELLNLYINSLPDDQIKTADELVFLAKNIGYGNSDAVKLILSNLKLLNENQLKEITRPMIAMLTNEFAEARKEKKLVEEENALQNIELLVPSMNEEQVNNVNRYKVLFYTERKDSEKLKVAGSSIASKLMLIPDDLINRKNQEFYDEVMAPFLSGKEDSTKIPGFSEESKRMKKNFAAGIASGLYMVAEAYYKTLEPTDRALNDSLLWAERAHALTPNEATLKLRENIKAKIGS
ncbi:thioredoxin family protein [Pedobacter agri]|uniref:thioredoxin family protein n=1 Tax=Pedobacter agri TaxID=454586 RepID=UPI00292EAC61|nr:thioredoxin family protein [Pedobacter agri]